MTDIKEPVDLETYGFPGYSIYRDGRIWSYNTRGPNRFKNIDQTGCTLLKDKTGRFVRKSAKVIAFQIYEVPKLLEAGFVPIIGGAYLINRSGDVYSVLAAKKLIWQHNRQYWCVRLFNKSWLVHRLVAMTFIPNPNNYPEVDHKNGIKSDNRVENLRWIDRSGNMKNAYLNGALDESLSKAFAAKGLVFKKACLNQ